MPNTDHTDDLTGMKPDTSLQPSPISPKAEPFGAYPTTVGAYPDKQLTKGEATLLVPKRELSLDSLLSRQPLNCQQRPTLGILPTR